MKNFKKQSRLKKTCWDIKFELENLEIFDFYVEIVYGNVKQNQKDACIIYSGHKNKALDFVYGNYNDDGEYYLPELEEILEDIELDNVPKKEILKHYYKVKEIFES